MDSFLCCIKRGKVRGWRHVSGEYIHPERISFNILFEAFLKSGLQNNPQWKIGVACSKEAFRLKILFVSLHNLIKYDTKIKRK